MSEDEQVPAAEISKKDTCTFDSRRKILTRKIITKDKLKHGTKDLGTYEEHSTQLYPEEGIRYIVGELKGQRQTIQETLSAINKTIENTNHLGELTEFDKQVQESINRIGQLRQRTEALAQRDRLLDDMNRNAQEYQDVIRAVGEHLKFD